MNSSRFFLSLLLTIVFGGLLLTGCATHNPDEYSEQPWNTPQQWEGAPAIPGMSTY